jgi:hypothetical protein
MVSSIINDNSEIVELNSNYVRTYNGFYKLVNRINPYPATEGGIATKSVDINDINLGAVFKTDTEKKKTVAVETKDVFKKVFFQTEIQKSQYQDVPMQKLHDQIMDQLEKEYDYRFLNGDEFDNRGVFQTSLNKAKNYLIEPQVTTPTTADDFVSLIKSVVRESLSSGNGIKQILPFGGVNAILDKQLPGTNSTFKDYIQANVSNVNFIDPLNIVGVDLTGTGGFLVINFDGVSMSRIREPNLNDTGTFKKDTYYIYESSTNQLEVDLKNAIVRQDLT